MLTCISTAMHVVETSYQLNARVRSINGVCTFMVNVQAHMPPEPMLLSPQHIHCCLFKVSQL